MAFFTRPINNMPSLPPEENSSERMCVPDHRRHASEPSRINPSRNPTYNHAIRKSSGPSTSTIVEVPSPPQQAMTAKGDRNSKILESTASEVKDTDSQKNVEDEDGEPKRYEYVVDRVLGVEV